MSLLFEYDPPLFYVIISLSIIISYIIYSSSYDTHFKIIYVQQILINNLLSLLFAIYVQEILFHYFFESFIQNFILNSSSSLLTTLN